MSRCPNHPGGKHDWRGPGGRRVPPGAPSSGASSSSLSMLACHSCGISYASAIVESELRLQPGESPPRSDHESLASEEDERVAPDVERAAQA